MSSEIITALISAAVTIFNVVFTTSMSRIAEKKRREDVEEMRQNDRTKQLESGVQCLLRAEIIRCHDKYTVRKYCPVYAKENLNRAYTAYHNLGGNDIATALYDACMELPEQPPNEESEDEE